MSIPTVTLTKKELESKWKEMLGATLEAWAHMILFVRKVYPEESFCSPTTTLFGLRLHQNRHPLVASYIAEAVQVALPSLTSHVADSITLTLIDEIPLAPTPPALFSLLSQAQQEEMIDVDEDDNGRINNDNGFKQEFILPEPVVLEKYELRFPQQNGRGNDDHSSSNNNNNNTVYSQSTIEYLEREMRAILLAVYAMKDTDDGVSPSSSDTLSFTISLHIPDSDATCDSLDRAVATGQWRTPPTPNAADTTTSSHKTDKTPYVIRPLHYMDAMTLYPVLRPVQFLVRYPRPVRVASSGGQQRNRRRPRNSLDQLSSDTPQSTQTLDF